MTTETQELDTTSEVPSPNGHDETWLTFDDDQAFLNHILSKEPVEELIEVPEWGVKVLCRALDPKARIQVEMAAYNKETRQTDYRPVFDLIVMAGCYNPTTGRHFLTESKRKAIMGKNDGGGPMMLLALTVMRLSRMLAGDAKKK